MPHQHIVTRSVSLHTAGCSFVFFPHRLSFHRPLVGGALSNNPKRKLLPLPAPLQHTLAVSQVLSIVLVGPSHRINYAG